METLKEVEFGYSKNIPGMLKAENMIHFYFLKFKLIKIEYIVFTCMLSLIMF